METLTNWIHWSIHTWGGLPIAVQSYILSIIAVSAIIESIKRSFLMNLSKRKRLAYIWRVSFIVSLTCGFLGWYATDSIVIDWYWLFIGMTSGSVSMGLHWITLKIIWPYIQKRFNKNDKSN